MNVSSPLIKLELFVPNCQEFSASQLIFEWSFHSEEELVLSIGLVLKLWKEEVIFDGNCVLEAIAAEVSRTCLHERAGYLYPSPPS